jgi:hypothetical protein
MIGVWHEPAAPYGVGIHPIKGWRQLSAIVASRAPDRMRLLGS